MMLNLNIDKLAGPGRAARPVTFEIARELNAADLELLSLPMAAASTPAQLKKITDRHHSLARLLAAGTPEGEAAMIVGYDQSRVSILKNSPAFQELLALYRAEVKREFASVLDHMAGLSRDALLELRDRLEDSPDKFTNQELLKTITELTDRSIDRDAEGGALPLRIELIAPATDDDSAD